MINLETVKTLRALRLPGMANELESQLEDPQRYKGLTFEDRITPLHETPKRNRAVVNILYFPASEKDDKSGLTGTLR